MNARRRNRLGKWAKWSIRAAGLLAILGIIAATLFLGWLQSPAGVAWVNRQLESRIPGEIEIGGVRIFLTSGIELQSIDYRYPLQNDAVSLTSHSIRLVDLLFGDPQFLLLNNRIQLQELTLLDAARLQIDMLDRRGPVHLSLQEGWIDPFAIEPLVQTDDEGDDGAALSLPALQLNLDSIRVVQPIELAPLAWSGEITLATDAASLQTHLFGVLQDQRQQGRIQLKGNIERQPALRSDLSLDIRSLPLQVSRPFAIGGWIDQGSASIRPATAGHHFKSAFSISQASAAFTEQFRARAGQLSSTAAIELATDFAPIASQAQLRYASLAINDASRGLWQVPNGLLTAQAKKQSGQTSLTSRLQLPPWGDITAKSADWPLRSTSPFALDLSLEALPLTTLWQWLPASLVSTLNNMQGMLYSETQGAFDNQHVQRITSDSRIEEGEWDLGAVRLQGVELLAHAQGEGQRITSDLQSSLVLQFMRDGDAALELPIDGLEGTLRYQREPYSLDIETQPIDAGIFQGLLARWQEGNRWTLQTTLQAEEASGTLFSLLMPQSERTLEGMGVVSLHLDGQGSGFSLQAQSEDLALFSFMQDPSFGLQLRDMDLTWKQTSTLAGLAYSMRLEAASPYISFDGADYEWLGQKLAIQLQSDPRDHDELVLNATPPGGGQIAANLIDNTTLQIDAHGLNLEQFVMPIVNRFIMNLEADETPRWQVAGSLNAAATMILGPTQTEAFGLAHLRNSDIQLDLGPGLRLGGVDLNAPFAFPPRYDRMPQKELRYQAASTNVADVTYENLAFEIAISPETIGYATPWSLPIYGGLVRFSELGINNWQGEAPTFAGMASFEQVNLQNANQWLDRLPPIGEVNGSVRLRAASRDQLNATGEIDAQLFGGRLKMRQFSISNPLRRTRELTLSADLESIELKPLVDYLNFGEMTGTVSGYIHDLHLNIPPRQSNELPKPTRFDLKLSNEIDDAADLEMISRDTLEKIIEMGEQSQLARMVAERERYLYQKMGLRATLQDGQMRIYGTLRDNLFLSSPPSIGVQQFFSVSNWFVIPINIMLAKPDEVIPFEHVWQTLRGQIRGQQE